MSVLSEGDAAGDRARYRTPTLCTSLLVVLASYVVFLHGIIRNGFGDRFKARIGKMVAAVTVLGTAYLLIGSFAGFSILLGSPILVAVYGLFDPAFGTRETDERGDHRRVP